MNSLDQQEDSLLYNNKSTTNMLQRGYEHSALLGRNKSQMRIGGPLSSLSQISGPKSVKFNEDVKVKLAYEWKNIFRAVS